MRCTSWTPSSTSSSAVSNCREPPTAPSTVRSAPVERCTSNPISISLAMTPCTWASVARSRMTTTIWLTFFLRLYFVRDPLQMPRLVDDPLEEALDGLLIQRAVVDRLDVAQPLVLPLRLVDGHAHVALHPSNLQRARRACIQQPDERLVQQVDPL